MTFEIEPLATRDQIFIGMHDSPEFNLPENKTFTRDRPRASGLIGDARELAYMMAGVVKSDPNRDNPERRDLIFTQETGRLAEDLTREGIRTATGVDFSTNVALPDDAWITGHPDGEALVDGFKWGMEHKLLGRFQYRKLVEHGILRGYPTVLAQMILYGYFLDWDFCQLVVGAQDGSSIKVESYRGKWSKGNPDFHQKMMVYGIDLRPLYALYIPELQRRAEWFMNWSATDGDPTHVPWERDPTVLVKGNVPFPWSYSEWFTQAVNDGPTPAGFDFAPRPSLLELDHAKN